MEDLPARPIPTRRRKEDKHRCMMKNEYLVKRFFRRAAEVQRRQRRDEKNYRGWIGDSDFAPPFLMKSLFETGCVEVDVEGGGGCGGGGCGGGEGGGGGGEGCVEVDKGEGCVEVDGGGGGGCVEVDGGEGCVEDDWERVDAERRSWFRWLF